jgi:hypothetical protein
VADKGLYEASGLTILSVEETLAMIKDLVGKLCKGNWEQVVVWMNSHGL